MSSRVRTHSSRLDRAAAVCEQPGCRWEASERNAQGIAVQHHDRTGHPVRVETTRIDRYGAARAVDPADLLPLGDLT